jgi:hypothetical protein
LPNRPSTVFIKPVHSLSLGEIRWRITCKQIDRPGLSQIKSEHIGDAVRPGPDGKEYARLCEDGVMSVHP